MSLKTYDFYVRMRKIKTAVIYLTFFNSGNRQLKTKKLSIDPALLVFYCCVTNIHKLSDLQTPLINTSQFWRSELGSAGFSAYLGAHKARIKVLATWVSHLEAPGRNLLPNSFMLLAECSSDGCSTEVPVPLLPAKEEGSPSAPRQHSQSFSWGPLHLQSRQSMTSAAGLRTFSAFKGLV